VGRCAGGKGRGKSRFKIRGFLADGRCSQWHLASSPPRMWEGWSRLSEVSEWELWELREREEELGAVAKLGAGGGGHCRGFCPPSFMASADEE